MGNPQETELTLAFLAGLIEGEGCFSVHRRSRTDGGKARNGGEPTLNYKAHIAISNSDGRMIEDVHQILDSFQVGHYVQWHGMGLKKGSINPHTGKMVKAVRSVGQINIMGMKRCQTFIPLVLPYLRYKKDQAELMLQWIEYRLSIPYASAISQRKATTYGDYDDQVYRQMHELKSAGSSTTTRESHTTRYGLPDDGKI
ncbi:MAG: LAGLIDADG family homing endonuclease [Caldilineaceae bacterium]|nr:LAGLIDADG family homing endonuclease [Caldilineaceae bacterium]